LNGKRISKTEPIGFGVGHAQPWSGETVPKTKPCVHRAHVPRALDESAMGKHINNRPLRVAHLRDCEPIDGCQVLFIAARLLALAKTVLGSQRGH
jgi:hypothetical protein